MAFGLNGRVQAGAQRKAVWILAGLVIAVAAGCSGGDKTPVGTVSGTVTFNNQPLPEGMLYAYNRESANAGEGEIRDGKFELLSELRTGNYVVFVTAIPPPPPSPDQPRESIWGKFPRNLPEKYQREDKSSLTIEVKEGHNEVTIDIPSS